jgi:hypothetical protein
MVISLFREWDGDVVLLDVEINPLTLRLGQIIHAHTSQDECWTAKPELPHEPSYKELVSQRAQGA